MARQCATSWLVEACWQRREADECRRRSQAGTRFRLRAWLAARSPQMPATSTGVRSASIVHARRWRPSRGPARRDNRWIANGKLRGMHSDRDTACARRAVIACQRRLMTLVEPAIRIERQRMRRNHETFEQAPAKIVDVHFRTYRRRFRNVWVCRGCGRRGRAMMRRPPSARRRRPGETQPFVTRTRIAEQRFARWMSAKLGPRAESPAEKFSDLGHREYFRRR